MTNKHYQTNEAGFTLIELSIVLVIIGLIVGGVLVGQDLIRAAEIRATVTQIEKYNTAVNTFRGKYNGIPGDIAEASAAAFGLDALSTASTVGGTGSGDGNGLIETSAGTPGTNLGIYGEPVLFWHHLSNAGYTDGQFGGAQGSVNGSGGAGLIKTDGTINGGTDPTSLASVNLFIPPAKLGRGNSIAVHATSGVNYFILGSFAQGSGSGEWLSMTQDTLTPTEAYNIDRKTDDGLPQSGTIVAMTMKSALNTEALLGSITSGGANQSSTACTGTAGGTTYNLATGFGTTQACALRIRFN